MQIKIILNNDGIDSQPPSPGKGPSIKHAISRFIPPLFALVLASCSSYDFSHRIVQQGTILSESKIAQLKPGMSKEAVAVLMGSSLLSPVFSEDRWDYAYSWRKGSGVTKIRHLVIYFKQDRLVNIAHRP